MPYVKPVRIRVIYIEDLTRELMQRFPDDGHLWCIKGSDFELIEGQSGGFQAMLGPCEFCCIGYKRNTFLIGLESGRYTCHNCGRTGQANYMQIECAIENGEGSYHTIIARH